MRRFFLAALLLSISIPVCAQFYTRPRDLNARTVIAVSDRRNGDPLIGATVTIASGADTLRGVTTKHSNGYYASALFGCDRKFKDSVSLEVTYVGYKPYSNRFSANRFVDNIYVSLTEDEQQIGQVVITGNSVALVFRGDTMIYNASAFSTMQDDRFSDLLKQLPGVEVKNGTIYAKGEPIKRIYIDGKDFFGTNTSAVLSDLEATDVRNIRVYDQENATSKRLGDNTAPKEKVMDVVTKSKRATLLGGSLQVAGGASLEKDFSGRNEARHKESMSFYRHSERGNLSINGSNSKDFGNSDMQSVGSKISPSKNTEGMAFFSLRRGDSTELRVNASTSRNLNNTIAGSVSEYFPTAQYTVRRSESTNRFRNMNFSTNLGTDFHLMRRKNIVMGGVDFRYEGSETGSSGITNQLIDDKATYTQLNSTSEGRGFSVGGYLNYTGAVSDKSRLSFSARGNYNERNADGWRVDTVASTPGLRVKLLNDSGTSGYSVNASGSFGTKLGKNTSLSLKYSFDRDLSRSRQMSIDYLDVLEGRVDTVNSYNYTIDTYTNTLSASVFYRNETFGVNFGLDGVMQDVARDELFPVERNFPNRFYLLNPQLNLSLRKEKDWLHVNLSSDSRIVSTEMLRGILDASNPLALQVGNPDLKIPTSFRAMTMYSHSFEENAKTLSLQFMGDYEMNYIATQRRLFLESTPLPEYNYTAPAGSELTSYRNVGGSYNLSIGIDYAQKSSLLSSTVRFGVDYAFRQTPYFLYDSLYRSGNHELSFTAGLESSFSTKVRLSVMSKTAMGRYRSQNDLTEYLRQTVNGRLDLRFGKYFGFIGTIYEFYCNRKSDSLTQHNIIADAAAGRKFGAKDRFSLSLGVNDIFNRADFATTTLTDDYIQTSTFAYLGRYGYLKAAYTF